jgi:pantothenate kinase
MLPDLDEWIRTVEGALPRALTSHRVVVAIGGPPASGKSTLSAALADHWGDVCGILPLDGFHFDDAVLKARGHLDRKGAPHTFDVTGFELLLSALRANPELEIGVPRFDRSLELSRGSAAVIGPRQRIVLVEGNYLHATVEPWAGLGRLFDVTVAIEVPMDELQRRILERWHDHGLADDEARRRWERNDGPNAEWVVEHRAQVAVPLRTEATR